MFGSAPLAGQSILPELNVTLRVIVIINQVLRAASGLFTRFYLLPPKWLAERGRAAAGGVADGQDKQGCQVGQGQQKIFRHVYPQRLAAILERVREAEDEGRAQASERIPAAGRHYCQGDKSA